VRCGRSEESPSAGNEEPESEVGSLSLAAISTVLFAERIALARSGVGCWRDGLVVAAYLGEVGRLELQGEFHQGICDVSGGFVGDGVIG
jgi:hypothetical protein